MPKVTLQEIASNPAMLAANPELLQDPQVINALQILLDKQFCEHSFFFFVMRAWKATFGHDFVDGIHIRALCHHLQALWEGQITTLVANLPPGLGKSSISCVLYPAWIWLKEPSAGLWFSSFGQDTLDRDSLAMRRLIDSQWWQERFGEIFHLLDDQNQKRRYDNNKGGWRLAASIEARRGFGEHPSLVLCVHPDGKIRTNQGDIRIEEIVTKRLDVKVLSFNETTRETEWDDILEYEQHPANRSMVELTAQNGMSCCLTEDHPVFVEHPPQRYMPAAMLEHEHSLMCSAGQELMRSSVRSVSRMWQRPQMVYNLRIKKNHNYFVNGILAHNCDDPHDPEQAVSETERQMAIDYWTNKIATRGWVRGVRRAIVAQRLHQDDLSGYVLANTPKVTHLMMPMLFEIDRKCRTGIVWNSFDPQVAGGQWTWETHHGWEDPRTVEGQLVWPQGANQEKVDALKANMRRAHAIAGQLQQRPTSPDGDMFLAEWFEGITIESAPTNLPTVRAWDLASSTSARSDFTAGALAAYDGDILYLIHACWGKFPREKRNDEIRKIAQDDASRFHDYHLRFEYEGGSGGKDAPEMLCEALSNEFKCRIDKAMGKPDSNDSTLKGFETLADLLSRGRVRMVKGAWTERLIAECLSAPNGAHDDVCVVGGTLVATERGDIPIMHVTTNDRVLTRSGYKQVMWSGETSPSENVIALGFENNAQLECTPNHPLWIIGRGWTRADMVEIGDEVLSCESRLLNGAGEFGVDTRTPPGVSIGATTNATQSGKRRRYSSIAKSGKRRTEKYLPETTSTTLMTTMTIMQSRTWSQSHPPSTENGTLESARNDSGSILHPSATRHPHGTVHQKVVRGTRFMANARLDRKSLWRNNAHIAQPYSWPHPDSPNTAASDAAEITCHKSRKSRRYVSNADATTQRARGSESFAVIRVVSRLESRRTAPVYNLTVEGAHEFFASGVLVHNCDAAAHAARTLYQSGKRSKINRPLLLVTAEEEEALSAAEDGAQPVRTFRDELSEIFDHACSQSEDLELGVRW